MENELAQLLQDCELANLKEILIKHKVLSVDAIRMVSDGQFATMGVAIGHAAKIRSALEARTAGTLAAAKKERIKELVDKIKSEEVLKKGKKEPKYTRKVTTEKKVKEKKVHIGWLHRSDSVKDYKQVRKTGGGSVRQITYTDDNEVTVDFLISEGKRMFFPEGITKYGSVNRMKLELGNYERQSISKFTDTDGNECSYSEYLRNRGLFASRAYVYLMTTSLSAGTENSSHAGKDEGKAHPEPAQVDPMESLSPSPQSLGVARVGEEFATNDYEDHTLLIEYEEVKESSYSEVILRSTSFSRTQCYELNQFQDPSIKEIELHEYDPLENGFTVVSMCKGNVSFLQKAFDPLNADDPSPSFVFPSSKLSDSESVILHSPSEVWGYDGSQLVLGVVTSYHKDMANTYYTWYHNDKILKVGAGLCCIAVNIPGEYCVQVQNRGVSSRSTPVSVRPLRLPGSKEETKSDIPKHLEDVSSQLPEINKNDVKFSSQNEIGRGAFGVVYRGEWAGTVVAVKVMKVRNAKRMRVILDTEVRVHCTVRHPNIIQIMAISLLKNSIYLVSEYIEGPNLEQVLFSDEYDSEENGNLSKAAIRNNVLGDKVYIGKQICQAVAYLHHLKTPIVHRDIKPANILIDKKSHLTKLCDMGLSRLKNTCATTTTQAGQGIPGTPHYMAPECLLEKKSATVQSDIWSLGCTLVELLSEKDCWQDLLGEDEIEVQSVLKTNKRPSALQELSPVVAACFHYDPAMRPSAIELINAL